MKTRLASMLVLAATLATAFNPSISPAAETAPALAVRVGTVNSNGWAISRGLPGKKLINRCGHPDARLSANIWVYNRYSAVPNRPELRGCDTLIVTITEGVVSDLHLVNDRAQAVIAARAEAGAPAMIASR